MQDAETGSQKNQQLSDTAGITLKTANVSRRCSKDLHG